MFYGKSDVRSNSKRVINITEGIKIIINGRGKIIWGRARSGKKEMGGLNRSTSVING